MTSATVAPAARACWGDSRSAVGLLDEPKRKMTGLSLGEDCATARVSMANMAASMGFMFAAMQLMRSAM